MGNDDNKNVTALRLTPSHIAEMVSEAAKDSRRVVMLEALTRRIDAQAEWPRLITRRRIDRCLLDGELAAGPELDEHNNWTCTLRRLSAGIVISVKCALVASERGGFEVIVLDYSRD